ncbi:MAG: pyridoxamine 5'-phosphate oxidase [Pseudomonadota bacterium]
MQDAAQTADPFAAGADPFDVFDSWMAEAGDSEINDANAMALATVDADGLPNVRTVLLKGLDGAAHPSRGFVFYTNVESQKGRELLASRKAALLFHWKSLGRQVRVRGDVTSVTAEEADAYYASRARGSRIGAWASKQSRPLESRAELEQQVASFDEQFSGDDVPRPPHWSGFRVVPCEIEFWLNGPYRLHDRIVFRRRGTNSDLVDGADAVGLADTGAAGWETARLYP